jgi:anti-anti-sigma regulatory factor
MVQVTLARGWNLEVERGPDWLFVRPRRSGASTPGAPSLGEQIWSLLEQSFAHRLVLEMDEVGRLDSQLIGELVWLEDRIVSHEGMMRICGLSSGNQEMLRLCELDGHFPGFRDREAAVMGQPRPKQPR